MEGYETMLTYFTALEEGNLVPEPDKKQTEGEPRDHFAESIKELLIVACTEMELDQDAATTRSKSSGKGKIEKRRSSRKTSIVFPKYKNGKKIGKAKGKK